MSKQTTPTVHGDVEYETVECDSCGNELAKESADRLIVGDVDRIRTSDYRPDEIRFNSYTLGWVCPYCNSDPASFPDPDAPTTAAFYTGALFGLVASLVIVVLIVLL